MFSEIVNYKYSEVKRKYHNIKSMDNVSKVITMNNCDDIDSYSNQSDILIYFDVVTEELLTIVERLEKTTVNMSELHGKVDEFNSQHVNYVASINENEEYVDLTVIHNSLAIQE